MTSLSDVFGRADESPTGTVYFDGRTSARHVVSLSVHDGVLTLEGAGVGRRDPLKTVHVGEPIGTAPRVLRYPDGASCEVAGAPALAWLAEVAPARPTAAVWLAARPWRVTAALALLLAGLVAAYRIATPFLAREAARRLPKEVASTVGQRAFVALDETVFSPSQLSQDRQADILRLFYDVRWPGAGATFDLSVVFRSSRAFGANALALPDGTIILTDELVALARSDDEILAVLAHEVGHVSGRHGLRVVMQHSVVAMGITWLAGDASTFIATVPATLLNARYTRDLEREADGYAIATLNGAGRSAAPLADLLERLRATRAAQGDTEPPAFLSTHPPTDERIARLRGGG